MLSGKEGAIVLHLIDLNSVENEYQVLETLHNTTKTRLDSYSTTLEQDEELLLDWERFPGGSNERNIQILIVFSI